MPVQLFLGLFSTWRRTNRDVLNLFWPLEIWSTSMVLRQLLRLRVLHGMKGVCLGQLVKASSSYSAPFSLMCLHWEVIEKQWLIEPLSLIFLTVWVPKDPCAVTGCFVIASVTPIQHPELHNVRQCVHTKNKTMALALADFKYGLWFILNPVCQTEHQK